MTLHFLWNTVEMKAKYIFVPILPVLPFCCPVRKHAKKLNYGSENQISIWWKEILCNVISYQVGGTLFFLTLKCQERKTLVMPFHFRLTDLDRESVLPRGSKNLSRRNACSFYTTKWGFWAELQGFREEMTNDNFFLQSLSMPVHFKGKPTVTVNARKWGSMQ